MITMAKSYKIRPSKILNISNDYDAFCLDEACEYILCELSQEKPKVPNWIDKKEYATKHEKVNNGTIEWMMKHNKAL